MSFGLSTFAQAIASAILFVAVLTLYLYRFTNSKRWLLVVAGVCLLDQYVKLFVLRDFQDRSLSLLFGTIKIAYLQNREQGFGGSFAYLLLLTTVCVLAMLFLYERLTRTTYRMSTLAEVGFALMIGGYIGILLDRIRRGFVVDFLEFGKAGSFVYNLADLAVILACALLCIRAVRYLIEPRDWRKSLLDDAVR